MKNYLLQTLLVVFVGAAIFFAGCATQTTKIDEESQEKTPDEKIEPVEIIDGNDILSGKFEGKSNHITLGTATVVKISDGYVLKLGADFSFDSAPAPKWAFGKDGFKKETVFAPLKKDKGEQTYKIPDSINPEEFNEVWLWCEKFSVPLGVAKLSKS